MWFHNNKLVQEDLKLDSFPVQRDWQIVTRSYAPPRRDLAGVQLPDKLAEKAVCGVTTYLWQDKNSGELRKEELLGSDADELGELVERVERLGMQYIKINGNSYAIAKVPPTDTATVSVK